MTLLKFDAKTFYKAFEEEVDQFITLDGNEYYLLSHESLNNFMGKLYNRMMVESSEVSE